MDTTHVNETGAIALNRVKLAHQTPAFQPNDRSAHQKGALVRVLASSFLKYTRRSKQLAAADSVENFIQLHGLYTELQQLAEDYLHEERPFIRENGPINQLLLSFASYRLSRATRVYYAESLQGLDAEELQVYKNQVEECVRDFQDLSQAL